MVGKGETLSIIAAKFGYASWEALARENPQIANPNDIREGQLINVMKLVVAEPPAGTNDAAGAAPANDPNSASPGMTGTTSLLDPLMNGLTSLAAKGLDLLVSPASADDMLPLPAGNPAASAKSPATHKPPAAESPIAHDTAKPETAKADTATPHQPPTPEALAAAESSAKAVAATLAEDLAATTAKAAAEIPAEDFNNLFQDAKVGAALTSTAADIAQPIEATTAGLALGASLLDTANQIEAHASQLATSLINPAVTGSGAAPVPWYMDPNTTSTAQGMNSAFSLIQALESGNGLAAATAAVSMLNSFAKAVNAPSQPFSTPAAAGLGAVAAGFNLYDALKAEDALAASAAAANMSSQIVIAWTGEASNTVATGLGQVAGILSIANSIKNDDPLGAMIGTITMMPGMQLIGAALSIARAVLTDPPEPRGTAEIHWNENGELVAEITASKDGGGKSALTMMKAVFAPLEGFLADQRDANGEPLYGIIPQRLPSVSFYQKSEAEFILNYTDENGVRVSRHYDKNGERDLAGFEGDKSLPEEFIDRAMAASAVVPKWEAETVRARIEAGDSDAWREPSEGAGLPQAAQDGLVREYTALTLDLGEDTAASEAWFDTDGNGFYERTQWVGAGQVLFAIDRDGDGRISHGGELLNTGTNAGRARNSLAWLDANNDGLFDAKDPAFTAVRLWLDLNRDAVSEAGELATLNDLGVVAIDFTSNPPAIIDGDGNRSPLTLRTLSAGTEGVKVAAERTTAEVSYEDGTRVRYVGAGDSRIRSVPRAQTSRDELDTINKNNEREAGGMFLAAGALLTGVAVSSTAAAAAPDQGNPQAPAIDLDRVIAAANDARRVTDEVHTTRASTPTTAAATMATVAAATATGHAAAPAGSQVNVAPDKAVVYQAPEQPTEGEWVYTPGAAADAMLYFTPPVLTDEIVDTDEDATLVLAPAALLANDYSLNAGAVLRVSAVSQATHGSVSLLDSGEIVFVPEANYFGPAEFRYTVTDQYGFASEALAALNIAPVNDAPVIEAIEFGRPVFGYQTVVTRQWSWDWQPGWNYNPATGQYYQDVASQQAVEDETLAMQLVASNLLNDAAGQPLTPNYYQNGRLRPVAFDLIDALDMVTDADTGAVTYTPLDDPMRINGRIIANDIDGDPSLITLSIATSPGHGHAAAGWYVPATVEPWPDVAPNQLVNYAVADASAWQYTSHPYDPYHGLDPFEVAVTDGAGGTTLTTVAATHFGTAQGGKKPVTLDLDGNGLAFVNLDDSNAWYDVNGDGWREHIAWVGDGDGLLVLDIGRDGVISRPEEISFAAYSSTAMTDLEGLRAFDSNFDNVLSALDARFGDFGVWVDANGDGISDAGEVRTLDEAGIAALHLTSDGQRVERGDVTVMGTTTFEYSDGRTGLAADASFGFTHEAPRPPAPTAEQLALLMTEALATAAPGADSTPVLMPVMAQEVMVAVEDPAPLASVA